MCMCKYSRWRWTRDRGGLIEQPWWLTHSIESMLNGVGNSLAYDLTAARCSVSSRAATTLRSAEDHRLSVELTSCCPGSGAVAAAATSWLFAVSSEKRPLCGGQQVAAVAGWRCGMRAYDVAFVLLASWHAVFLEKAPQESDEGLSIYGEKK